MSGTILLADDSLTIQKVIELTFAETGFEVIAVSSGEELMQKLPECRPDVVICDVIMPGKDGYEVCQEIKSEPDTLHIPVILLTGTFEPFDRDRAVAAGCSEIITKPFEAKKLVEAVERLVAGETLPAPDAQSDGSVQPPAFEGQVVPPPPQAAAEVPPPPAVEAQPETPPIEETPPMEQPSGQVPPPPSAPPTEAPVAFGSTPAAEDDFNSGLSDSPEGQISNEGSDDDFGDDAYETKFMPPTESAPAGDLADDEALDFTSTGFSEMEAAAQAQDEAAMTPPEDGLEYEFGSGDPVEEDFEQPAEFEQPSDHDFEAPAEEIDSPDAAFGTGDEEIHSPDAAFGAGDEEIDSPDAAFGAGDNEVSEQPQPEFGEPVAQTEDPFAPTEDAFSPAESADPGDGIDRDTGPIDVDTLAEAGQSDADEEAPDSMADTAPLDDDSENQESDPWARQPEDSEPAADLPPAPGDDPFAARPMDAEPREIPAEPAGFTEPTGEEFPEQTDEQADDHVDQLPESQPEPYADSRFDEADTLPEQDFRTEPEDVHSDDDTAAPFGEAMKDGSEDDEQADDQFVESPGPEPFMEESEHGQEDAFSAAPPAEPGETFSAEDEVRPEFSDSVQEEELATGDEDETPLSHASIDDGFGDSEQESDAATMPPEPESFFAEQPVSEASGAPEEALSDLPHEDDQRAQFISDEPPTSVEELEAEAVAQSEVDAVVDAAATDHDEELPADEPAAPAGPDSEHGATPAPEQTAPSEAGASEENASGLSDADVDRIAKRMLELAASKIERIAWDVVPDMAEIVVRERIRELEDLADSDET